MLKTAATHVAATLAIGREVMASWPDREASVLPTTASGGAMDPKEIRQRLGLSEDASDEQVRDTLRALNAAAGEAEPPAGDPPADPPAADPPADPPVEPPAEPPAAPTEPEERQSVAAGALPPGVVAIDEATLAALRDGAETARTLAADRNTERREQLVAAAIGDGRIPPARRDHWLSYLTSDPEGGAQALASLEPGLVPVQERGHGHSVDTLTDSEIESETVSGWTQQLFPETRNSVAAAAGDVPVHSRIASDGKYRRGGMRV
jgi:hypothetical protein